MEPLGKVLAKVHERMIKAGRLADIGPVPDDFDPYAEFGPPDGGPQCSKCRGSRFLRQDLPRDHPSFGITVRCDACAPYFDQQRIDKLIGTLPKLFRPWTLDSFPSQANNVDIVKMLRDDWLPDKENPWLYMYSTARVDERSGRVAYASGRGKTGLAVGLGKTLATDGKTVVFFYVPDVIQRLKDGFKNPDDAYGSGMIRAAREADIVILDDLGAGKASEWANKDVMMPLISSLHTRADDVRVIITSNLSPTELVAYFEHDRAVTRIEERCTSDLGFWVLDMSDMTDLRLNKSRNVAEEVAF